MKYGEDCDGAWVFRGLVGVKKSNMKEEGSRLGEECGVNRVAKAESEWKLQGTGQDKKSIEMQDRYGKLVGSPI